MEAVKFSWFLRDIYCRRQSLKEATKELAIVGIIAFLLGTGAYCYNFYLHGVTEDSLALGEGIMALLDGILLMINILHLNAARDNGAAWVFKTALTLNHLQLIVHFVRINYWLSLLILWPNTYIPLIPLGPSFLVAYLVRLVLNILAITVIIPYGKNQPQPQLQQLNV